MIAPSRVLRLAAAALVLAAMAACTREVDVGELRAAIGDSPVVMLSTTTCGYCRQLRADLGDWGVDFEDLDVESDQNGWDAYEQVNGRGVPILIIGDAVLHGYEPERARSLLAQANLLPES